MRIRNKRPAGRARGGDHNEELRKRLAWLAGNASQLELSRQTGVLATNINRYLKGTKVPADFCGALVEKAGVNPAWLLAGEGTPYLTDVSAAGTRKGSNLLELVEAMSAVTSMRLGALAGKRHLKTLRELNDGLAAFERMRMRLARQARPVFKELIGDLRKAVRSADKKAAEKARGTLEQLALISDDSDLQRELELEDVGFQRLMGNAQEALELQRATFRRTLATSRISADEKVRRACDLVTLLRNQFRMSEALSVCDACIELAQDEASEEVMAPLKFHAGTLRVHLGQPQTAVDLMVANLPLLCPEERPAGAAMLRQTLVLLGVYDLGDAIALAAGQGEMLAGLCSLALWREDDSVQAVKKAARGVDTSGMIVFQYLRFLDNARARKQFNAGRFTRLYVIRDLGQMIEPAPRFAVKVIRCQAVRIAGKREQAMNALKSSEQLLGEVPDHVTLPILWRATHYSNAIRLLAKNSGARRSLRGVLTKARRFFETVTEQGFRFFSGAEDRMGEG